MKTHLLAGSMLLASSFFTACAPKSAGTTPPTGSKPDTTYDFQVPTVTAVNGASGTPAIGDTIRVLGAHFIDPQHGSLLLSFVGNFTDQDGHQTHSAGTPIPLTYVAPGEATFVLGPDNVFGPSGTVGQFVGAFQVQNTLLAPATNGHIGDQSTSAPVSLTFTIGPSIFLDELRSVDAQASGSPCAGATPFTTGAQNIRLGFHFVGMDDASDADPVYYTVTYDASQLTVAYVGNQTYGSWPFWGPTSPSANASVATGSASFSTSMTTGNGMTFDPQTPTQQVVSVSPAVTINQQNVSTVKLAGLATIPAAAGSNENIQLLVRAEHQSGTTINRVITWNVRGAVAFSQPTPQVLTAWEAPILDPEGIGITRGTVPNGANMTYSESTSDTKQKSINMSWNVNNSQNLGVNFTEGLNESLTLGINPPGVNAAATTGVSFSSTQSISQTWSQTFGTDVSTSDAITTMQGSSTSVQVNPGMFGAFYIQWGDLTSTVHVTFNDACGNSADVGVATLTSHVGYLAAETSTLNPPPCPADASDCHPAGPIAN